MGGSPFRHGDQESTVIWVIEQVHSIFYILQQYSSLTS